jgi:hypothetical protein
MLEQCRYTDKKKKGTKKNLTKVDSIVFIVPFSEIGALGEEPSSYPSLTGEGG